MRATLLLLLIATAGPAVADDQRVLFCRKEEAGRVVIVKNGSCPPGTTMADSMEGPELRERDINCEALESALPGGKTIKHVKLDAALKRLQDFHDAPERCDEYAGLGESIDDTVTKLFAYRWSEMLHALDSLPPSFRSYLLQNVGGTAGEEDMAAVKDNATNHCPQSRQAVCSELLGRLN